MKGCSYPVHFYQGLFLSIHYVWQRLSASPTYDIFEMSSFGIHANEALCMSCSILFLDMKRFGSCMKKLLFCRFFWTNPNHFRVRVRDTHHTRIVWASFVMRSTPWPNPNHPSSKVWSITGQNWWLGERRPTQTSALFVVTVSLFRMISLAKHEPSMNNKTSKKQKVNNKHPNKSQTITHEKMRKLGSTCIQYCQK